MQKKFLLCFHDFSVWNYSNAMPIIEKLKALAGGPFSILVIPCTEGADAKNIVQFQEVLAQLKKEGFELALHGFKHKAEFSQGRSYAGLIGMNLTGGEAEFAGLSEYESSRLLQNGLSAWKKLDSSSEFENPVAFVPPTWYSNKYLPRQVRSAKMLYEDRFSLTTSNGKRYASPVVSFAGIPGCFEKIAFAFGTLIMKIPLGIPRIAVHPVDYPRFSEEISDLIRVALNNNRNLVHYCKL